MAYLPAFAFVDYFTETLDKGHDGVDDAFSAIKFVKAIKGEPFKGYGILPTGRQGLWFNSDTPRQTLFDWFASRAMRVLRDEKATYCLVPVPNSACDSRQGHKSSVPFLLAQALRARKDNIQCVPLLWWRSATEAAHKSRDRRDRRGRDPWTLFSNLQVAKVGIVQHQLQNMRIVLLDDVVTTGAHLVACEAALRTSGLTVRGALCAAISTKIQSGRAFERKRNRYPTLDFSSRPDLF